MAEDINVETSRDLPRACSGARSRAFRKTDRVSPVNPVRTGNAWVKLTAGRMTSGKILSLVPGTEHGLVTIQLHIS